MLDRMSRSRNCCLIWGPGPANLSILRRGTDITPPGWIALSLRCGAKFSRFTDLIRMIPVTSTDTAPQPGSSLPYPEWWEADVLTTDGSVVRIRPVVAADRDGLRAMHRR